MSEPYDPANPHPTAPYPVTPLEEPTAPQAPAYAYAYGHTEEIPAPRRRPKVWLWIAIGAVLLACCVGGTLGGMALFDAGQKAQNTAAGATPSASASASPSPTQTGPTVTLKVPETLAGYPKIVDKDMQAILGQETDKLKTVGNATSVFSGAYGNVRKAQLRMFVAATSDVANPGVFATGLAMGLKQSMKTSEMTDIDAGPLGGIAKCGTAKQNGQTATVCVWADSGSYGLIFFFNTKLAAAKTLFATARGDIESAA